MLNPAEQEKLQTVVRTHWLIYIAFVTAVVLYTVILFVVTGSTNIEPREMGTFRNILLLVSVAAVGAKFWIQSRLLFEEASYSACKSIDEVIQKYMSYNFMMLALCEVPALFGLIVVFITMRMEEWWVFFGISAFLFATSAPRRDRLERIGAAHAVRHQSGS